MPPMSEKSKLKRPRASAGEHEDTKKPRVSQRISDKQKAQQNAHLKEKQQLPSPVTNRDSSTIANVSHDPTLSPAGSSVDNQVSREVTPLSSPQVTSIASPPQDTQPFSQFIYPPRGRFWEVEDEDGENVWGYLVPLDSSTTEPLVLRERAACPKPNVRMAPKKGKERFAKKELERREEAFEQKKIYDVPSGGYLVGRHPECDRIIHGPTVSNRHCLIFSEKKRGGNVAVVEDLSSNGTFVNDALVGRNKRRELQDGDEISVLEAARFTFRYPHSRATSGFAQSYQILDQLGKGHFATVYLCVEKATGIRYAVKKFEKRGGSEKSRFDGLQQEIAVLMSVSHPNVLCLKENFDEQDGVFLVLELAPEGELFNWVVMKQRLSEAETRKVFVQLFQGIKYLHERNIVHRDIKPENILMVDKEMNVKLADFGLAKIIGEESFTTTLCGTPSYVAPEILENSNHRRYTRAVDVWSLGVVLYICLCGFPPFSDELYHPKENPYTLSQQIKLGRFDYPSPYWDSVGDLALDLIDRMLTVDVEKRISIDECLEHPWTTGREINPNDSTDGLTGQIAQLDFSRRKPLRERTLLSSLNDVKITKVIDINDEKNTDPIKIFDKNGYTTQPTASPVKSNGKNTGKQQKHKEPQPAGARAVGEFMQLGGQGDQELFQDDGGSRYAPDTMIGTNG